MSNISCVICRHPHCTGEAINDHGHTSPAVCVNAVQCFSAISRDSTGLVDKTKGCTYDHQHTALMCSRTAYNGQFGHEVHGVSAQYGVECCDEDMCNAPDVWPNLPDIPIIDDGTSQISVVVLAFTICLVLILVTLFVSIAVVIHRRHVVRVQRMTSKWPLSPLWSSGLRSNMLHSLDIAQCAESVGDSTMYQLGASPERDAIDVTSGSGSGMPFLVRRTLANEIDLKTCIGKGRYGEVWRGAWNGDEVAVKIFYSRDEQSWHRETEVYALPLIRHENILAYFASDFTSKQSVTQLWLVTCYHPLGSLYDFMCGVQLDEGRYASPFSATDIDLTKAVVLMYTAACGLAHLHSEIVCGGQQGKPGIAHRDIKSKNILVKIETGHRPRLVSVLADFGLAIVDRQHASWNTEGNTRIGTKRYMSPEVLDSRVSSSTSFESHRRSDVYSFALVLWELWQFSVSHQHALPYFDCVSNDPSFEDMRHVVINLCRRPSTDVDVDSTLPDYEKTQRLIRLLTECWHSEPSARPSALRVKKTLHSLSE